MLWRRRSGPFVRETFDDFREERAAICSARRGINWGSIAYSGVRANRLRPLVAHRSTPHGMLRKEGVIVIKTHAAA